jgi:hypothetical protein
MPTLHHLATTIVASALALTGAGCNAYSVMVHRPPDHAVDDAISRRWAREIRAVARTGDWILSRSYYLVADGIALGTGGVALSHASIYDAETDTVIEAVETGIREIPLEKLLERNHYAIVVRPAELTDAEQREAIALARAQVGGEFDGAGMFGMNDRDTFYCSELVWWAVGGDQRFGEQSVITPSEMLDYGEVVYWSGERDDLQMQHIAADEVVAPGASATAAP